MNIRTPAKSLKHHAPAKPSLEASNAQFDAGHSRESMQVRIPKKSGGMLHKGFRWGEAVGREFKAMTAAMSAARKW
eukprot:1039464-Pyramimonas_sp.AAC.1